MKASTSPIFLLQVLLILLSSRAGNAFLVSRVTVKGAGLNAEASSSARDSNNLLNDKFFTDKGIFVHNFENMTPSDILPGVQDTTVASNTNNGEAHHRDKDFEDIKPFKIRTEHKAILASVAKAQDEFTKLNQEEANEIFNAVAQEANRCRLSLAKMAFNETQMGCFEDKVLKNGLACELIQDRYKDSMTCGLIHEDSNHGMKTYAYPVGPICALTPVTNPTSTAIAKCLMMAKTRNAGIFLPHPKANRATAEAVRICCEAGERAGAPKGWVQSIDKPKMIESNAIMQSEEVRLILSTGGPGVVKASYTSGKPAIGVGSGNAPVLVDETADLHLACGSIVTGKTFDNGMICASEQSAVIVKDVYDDLKQLMEDRGVYFLNQADRSKLEKLIQKSGKINPEIVGKTAVHIAQISGIDVNQFPEGTLILGTEEEKWAIGDDFPLSKEKLSPILSLYKADDFDDGVNLCGKLARTGGIGHTAGLYTDINRHSILKEEREKKFVEMVPVCRVLVNSPTSLAAIGSSFNFQIDPSFSLGVGTLAGSSVSANVGPMHLINLVKVAERQDHIEWFNLPERIFYNRGCLEEGLRECKKTYATGDRDERVIIISGRTNKKLGYVDRVEKCLRDQNFQVEVFLDTHADPDMDCVRKGVEACNRFKPDLMICLGGGSPMDAGKFIRALYEHPELTLETASSRFIELRKRTIQFPKLGSKIRRLIAIPTTSGTGSEVSPFTVITGDDGRKYPIASYKLTPDIAICDSTLCESLPKTLIANSGIDAITHAIEAYVSVAQNDFTKMHALEALELLFGHLEESYEEGTPFSRDAIHRGATIAGIAFSNSFLGICHSLAHKVGAEFHLPHGLTNGILLPHVIRYNSSKKPTRMGIWPQYVYPQSHERYAEIANRIGASTDDTEGLVEKIQSLMINLEMPTTFKEAGVDKKIFMSKLDKLAEAAFDDQCTPANPRFPMIHELKEVLVEAFGDSSV